MPAPFEKKLGVHPMVCCPKVVDESSICFPSDPWCPTYEPPEYSPAPPAAADYPHYEDVLYEDFDPVDTDRLAPLESTSLGGLSFTRGLIYPKEWNNCGITADGSRSCVSLKKCPPLAQSSNAPDEYLRVCGFNTSDNHIKICCPDQMVENEVPNRKQPPRFPEAGDEPTKCQDKSKFCPRWKSAGGCRIEPKNIKISLLDDSFSVESPDLFDLMQTACPETCGWCSSSGCRDEHPNCESWSRAGACVTNPLLMGHTCRESCGVCGFLAPANVEEQTVGASSYTDFTRRNFDCGRFEGLEHLEEKKASEAQQLGNDSDSDIDVFLSSDLIGRHLRRHSCSGPMGGLCSSLF